MFLFPPQSLGGELRRLRLRRRKKQAELARLAGVSPIFIAKVEAGERMPSWDTLARLADVLDVAVRVALVRSHKRRS